MRLCGVDAEGQGQTMHNSWAWTCSTVAPDDATDVRSVRTLLARSYQLHCPCPDSKHQG